MPQDDDRVNWRRLVGLLLTDFFAGSPFDVELPRPSMRLWFCFIGRSASAYGPRCSSRGVPATGTRFVRHCRTNWPREKHDGAFWRLSLKTTSPAYTQILQVWHGSKEGNASVPVSHPVYHQKNRLDKLPCIRIPLQQFGLYPVAINFIKISCLIYTPPSEAGAPPKTRSF
jgi:hypothetical protein